LQNKEDISVIIPTFNRADTLINTINSVLKQTYPVHEIIICDDGSTDESRHLVGQLKDKRIKWLDCGRNGGPAIPRNMGVLQSTGNWIAFLDSDDEWFPHKIEKQIAAAAQYQLPVLCSNASRIRNGIESGSYGRFKGDVITFKDLTLENAVICSSVLVQKKLLLDISLFPEGKEFIAIEDYALWLRLSTRTNFVYLNENLLKYFDNFETSIRTNYSDSWVIMEIVFSDFKLWLRKKGIVLQKENRKILKATLKKIKHKGQTSKWEEYKKKAERKLKSLFS
jgi:teichuronic acid biosynthesis glycosyltransferase TuaG